MQPRHALLTTLAAVALTGCATTPGPTARSNQDCTGKCIVTVESSGDLVPPTVNVTEGKETEIRWKIRPWFVHFAEMPGIEFQEGDNGTKVFTNCRRDGWREFVCTNGGTPGKYKYTVRLLGREPVDPWVVNR